MCFVCSQREGFETDIAKVIDLSRNSKFEITRKEVEPIPPIQKVSLAITYEPNKTLDKSKSTYIDDFSNDKIQIKGKEDYTIITDFDFNDITGKPLLILSNETVSNLRSDISALIKDKGTFDQITGVNTNTAKMFRLYKAAFKRIPDANDLKSLSEKYSSGRDEGRDIANAFLDSTEFSKRFGRDLSDENYVRNLYQNVLGRAPDNTGMNYWLGQLTSGSETRSEVILGFAESAENKAIFTEITGFG